MTITEIQDQIIAEMSELEDWFDRYEVLIALGKEFGTCDESLCTDEYRISGCQSAVWLRSEVRDGRLRLHADSDSQITRGMLALLLRVFDGQPPDAAADAELYFLDDIGLSSNLSPSRANGLGTIVRAIRGAARGHAAEEDRQS